MSGGARRGATAGGGRDGGIVESQAINSVAGVTSEARRWNEPLPPSSDCIVYFRGGKKRNHCERMEAELSQVINDFINSVAGVTSEQPGDGTSRYRPVSDCIVYFRAARRETTVSGWRQS